MKTIISLWPVERVETRNWFTPTSRYAIPAAPIGGFSRLKVVDQYQQVYRIDGQYDTNTVMATEVAEDIVRSASKFKIGPDGRMGIYVHEIDDPTDEQVLVSIQHQNAVAEQDQLMHGIVNDARHLFSNGEKLQGYHHMAGKYLRIEGEKWQDRNTSRSATKQCPFCSAVLLSSVVKCNSCNEIVDEAGYAALRATIKAQAAPIPAPPPATDAPGPVVQSALTPAKKQAGA